MKRCPFCGHEEHDEAVLCKSCFRDLSKRPAPLGPRPPTARRAMPAGLGYLVAITMIAGAVMAVRWSSVADDVLSLVVSERGEAEPIAAPRDTKASAAERPIPEPSAGSGPSIPVRSRERQGAPASARAAPTSPPPASRPTAKDRPESVANDARQPAPRPAAATVANDTRARTSPARKTAQPIRVGGTIEPPAKIHDVTPVYPAVAVSARVQGTVVIEATIGPDGTVQATRVLRSIPLLDAAALDAVKQWRFEPTLLNGVAVPVIMTTTVRFALQ